MSAAEVSSELKGGPGLPDGLVSAVVVDVSAIRENTAVLDGLAGDAGVMAVVKADAYGHGLLPSARAALAGGAGWLGVAQLHEALALRAAGITAPTLAWLSVPGDAYTEAVAQHVDLGLSTLWALAEVADGARRSGVTARVHLKLDTGLGRNGAAAQDWPDLVDAALKLQAEGLVDLVGAFSHYAWADAPEHPTVQAQTRNFDDGLALAEARGARFEVRHLANSAATLTNSRARYDLVRPGIALYGVSPVPDLGSAADYGLRPAMSLLARVANVKDVAAGSGVSYGHEYTTTRDTTVALIPTGYADGIPRHAGNQGPVLLNGRRHRVAGRVCMDQVVLDLGRDHEENAPAQAGDVAVLFGDPATGAPSAQDWADVCGTIAYEIVTRVGSRVPRVVVGQER